MQTRREGSASKLKWNKIKGDNRRQIFFLWSNVQEKHLKDCTTKKERTNSQKNEEK